MYYLLPLSLFYIATIIVMIILLQNYSAKDHSLIPANLCGTISLGQSVTLILLHHSKALLKPTFPKLLRTCQSSPQPLLSLWCVCVCVCVCVCTCVGWCVSVAIVKRPVLPLYVEDGLCTNFLHHYYYYHYYC